MTETVKADYEAIGRHHAAMREARVALTKRNRVVGELRELMSQILAPGHAEFRVGGELLLTICDRVDCVVAFDKTIEVNLLLASQTAEAAGEVPPSTELMGALSGHRDEASLGAPITMLAHDGARDVSGGN